MGAHVHQLPGVLALPAASAKASRSPIVPQLDAGNIFTRLDSLEHRRDYTHSIVSKVAPTSAIIVRVPVVAAASADAVPA